MIGKPELQLGLFVIASCLSSCVESRQGADATPLEESGSTVRCIDDDDDGFGFACPSGNDCDDSDPDVTNECLCDEPNTGCDCDASGAVATCGTVYSKLGSQQVCGQGVMTCDGDKWGECIVNQAVTLRLGLASLNTPTECDANPCDPECVTFEDDPSNEPLSVDAGLVATDAGITLPQGSGTSIPGDAGTNATVNCGGGEYPLGGACDHHLCELGDALDETCDQDPPVVETIVQLSDSFGASDTLAWSFEGSWEVAPAESSSGHGYGFRDPNSDTSAGGDDRIAGTNVGGNISGGGTLFLDTFDTSFDDNWDQTGDGNWRATSIYDSEGYDGSGSRAPKAENCDNWCYLTLRDPIDLTGKTGAVLSFDRFLESRIDSGEFLQVHVLRSDGVWDTVGSWTHGDGDTDRWHAESVSLNAYLHPGFKVRFAAKMDLWSEDVQIDDVEITAPGASETEWMTSPIIDTSDIARDLILSFQRRLNVAAGITAMVEVFDGSNWQSVWQAADVAENSWEAVEYDITAYRNAAMRIRFGWTGSGVAVSGWNIDDVEVRGEVETPSAPGCVAKICDAVPSCCTSEWGFDCIDLVEDTCGIECARNTTTGECVACYTDPSDDVDRDGDGYSVADGDCRECDPTVNPGALDFPDNGIDEDCDGTADNEVINGCDASLSASGGAEEHARAIGLCKTASDGSWGLIDAKLVQADGTTACTDPVQYRILEDFGSPNLPTEGNKMAVYSTGTARDRDDSGWIQPDGWDAYEADTQRDPANPVPAAAGCSSGQAGNDSCGLWLKVKAPTNVRSFSFNFNFFTSEYPEWLCTDYNDAFVAYYYGAKNTQADKNISFDSLGNPVSVNNGLFTVPAWPPPTDGTHPKLDGSGYDGVCDNGYDGSTYDDPSICGGGTDWLFTSAPVLPGEEIELHFSIWDTGDHIWDSAVLLDNLTWSPEAAQIETGVYVPGSEPVPPVIVPTELDPGVFTRDYDMTEACGIDQVPVWSLWSWEATTPADSKIEFYVQTAQTLEELDSAPLDALRFSNPPGPVALSGTAAVAEAGSPNTELGSAVVSETLIANDRLENQPFLRMTVRLFPSSDKLQAPTLRSWNLEASCQDSQ